MAHGRCGLRLFAHGERLPDKGAWQLSGLILSNRGTFFFFFFAKGHKDVYSIIHKPYRITNPAISLL